MSSHVVDTKDFNVSSKSLVFICDDPDMVDLTDETISPTSDVNGLKFPDFSARGPVLEMIFPAEGRVDNDDDDLMVGCPNA